MFEIHQISRKTKMSQTSPILAENTNYDLKNVGQKSNFGR